MQKGEAFEILSKVGFRQDDPNTVVNLARAGKQSRLLIIRQTSSDPARHHCAAIEITRHWRSYLCRKELKDLFSKNDSNVEEVKIEKPVNLQKDESQITSSSVASKVEIEEQQTVDILNSASDITSYQSIKDSLDAEKTSSEPSHVYGNQKNSNSPTTDQQLQPKSHIKLSPFGKQQAATVIQKAWRRHIDMQVFRYYRDLINFRRQGNPSLMLRCINPAEAKLLDAATGTHIKFRLAGEKFPPNIYYKIFTHRPVVDMCANSPKDYTKPDAKQATSKQLHTKTVFLMENPEKNGWYQRIENNGWRLVSDRLIHAAMDPTTWETSKKTMEFHHDKLKRKSDIDKRRRRKKIAWMHKMYKQGMLQVHMDDAETNDLVKKAADGLIHTVDTHGPDGVMDWEVDELLQWTTALNFDDYLEGWKETATSNISEYEVEEMAASKLNKQNQAFNISYHSYPIYHDVSFDKKEEQQTYPVMQMPQVVKNP